MRARQSPTRRRHSPGRPLRLRTSPAGSRSIAARMRSRSLRGSLRRDFAAAGAITASHSGSSGVSVRLRAQLGYVDRLASLVGRPAFLRRHSIIPGVGFVVIKGSSLKGRQHWVLGTSQQDPGGVHALVGQLIDKAVQIGSRHGLNVAPGPRGDEPILCSQRRFQQRHERRPWQQIGSTRKPTPNRIWLQQANSPPRSQSLIRKRCLVRIQDRPLQQLPAKRRVSGAPAPGFCRYGGAAGRPWRCAGRSGCAPSVRCPQRGVEQADHLRREAIGFEQGERSGSRFSLATLKRWPRRLIPRTGPRPPRLGF